MKRVLRFFLAVGVCGILVGCKLAVIVVEGGEVRADASGTCAARTICIVEVADTNFSETFTAVPDPGWYFHKWNYGEKFFCGGLNEPVCGLSFEGHEESEAVKEMVASSETFYLMPVFREISPVIEVDGKLWAQPTLFGSVSWYDIEAICPMPSGACAGELNGVDLNGWTWASAEDVNALFNYYIGSNELGPGPDAHLELNSGWAPAFFSDGWLPSNSSEQALVVEIHGWISNFKSDVGNGYFASINNVLAEVENEELQDGAGTLGDSIPSEKLPGAWFYSGL